MQNIKITAARAIGFVNLRLQNFREETKMMNEKELRERIDLITPWLGNESRLKEDRPDLYDMWMDYARRKYDAVTMCTTKYERLLNTWLLHYFLVHGKK